MGQSDGAARHAFISYARQDARRVDELQKKLEAAGIPVWRDIADLWPGQDWRGEIRRAINDDSLAFIACFSSGSVARQKGFQNEEIILAIEQMRLRSPDAPWFVPVRFDDCAIPDWDIGAGRTLASIQAVDLFGERHEQQAERLVVAVRRILSGDPGKDGRPGLTERIGRRRYPVYGAEALAKLAPRQAARQAARMSYEHAFAALTDVPEVSAAAEIIEALLDEDEALAVAILADMRRDKARELIAAINSAEDWLKVLPTAAEEAERCERANRSILGDSVGSLSPVHSRMGTRGYYQNYERGQIHWSLTGRAQATAGAIGKRYAEIGSGGGWLGFPGTAEADAKPNRIFGTTGRYQRFAFHRRYGRNLPKGTEVPFGATIYWSEEHGAHATSGSIDEYYESQNGTAGWLGFPISDAMRVGPSHRDDGKGTHGVRQRFQGGIVYFCDKVGAIGVSAQFAEHHENKHSGVTSSLGFPVSPVLPATESQYGTSGYLQRFEGRWDYGSDIVGKWSKSEKPGGATIYMSAAHGAYCVGWGNGTLYERLGATGSWLGFPTSDEERRTGARGPSIQTFEGGAIYYTDTHDSVTVPAATLDYLGSHPGLAEQLGVPVRRDPGSRPEEPVQFFENGVVTIRDGVIEAWVRPKFLRKPS